MTFRDEEIYKNGLEIIRMLAQQTNNGEIDRSRGEMQMGETIGMMINEISNKEKYNPKINDLYIKIWGEAR